MPLTFLVNHFKAQDQTPGSKQKRAARARRVAELASVAAKNGRHPVVLGDLNAGPTGDGSLDPLLRPTKSLLQDPFSKDERTHYYVPGRKVSRLDYALPDKRLKVRQAFVERKGLTTKCRQYAGPRYATIGPEHTEASDHCLTGVVRLRL